MPRRNRLRSLTLATPIRTPKRLPFIQAVKTSVATIAAWFVAITVLPGQLPIFAAIAALLVVQPSVNQSLGKAVERSVGVIIASGIGIVFGQQGWIVLAAIVVSILIGWALRLTPGSSNQIPISAMLVLSIGATTPGYAVDRIIETLIGAAIGVIVNALIVPPVMIGPARADAAALMAELAASLDRLADILATPHSHNAVEGAMIEARLLRPMRDKAVESLSKGEESLTLNPRRSAHRDELRQIRELLDRLSPVVTRTIGMTRAVRDHYDATLSEESTVQQIARELHRAAHDLRLLSRPAGEERDEDAEPVTAEIPALTAPLVIQRPHPDHWILIGSLLEDLRRVREEIVGANS
jgi:uncharacterized membrane protein YgaE (UPF0421/DUF939 family)